MPKQSGYLQRQAAREQVIIDAVDQTARQLMLDTLQITLHTEYGWGFDRIKALSEAWAKRKTGGSSLRRFLQVCIHPTIDQRIDGSALCVGLFFQRLILLRGQPHPQLLLRR